MYRRSVLQILIIWCKGGTSRTWGVEVWLRQKDKGLPEPTVLLYDYCYYNGWIAETSTVLTLHRIRTRASGAPVTRTT